MSVCKYIHTSFSFKDINMEEWESEECKVVKGLVQIESTGGFLWVPKQSKTHKNKMPALVNIYINTFDWEKF